MDPFLWVGAVAFPRVGFLHMTVDHKMLYAGPCHTDSYWGKGSTGITDVFLVLDLSVMGSLACE